MPSLPSLRRSWGLFALLLVTSGLPAAVPDGGVVVVVTRDYVNRRAGQPRTDPVEVSDDVGKLSVRTRGVGTAYPTIYLIPGDDAARFHVVTRGTGSSVSEGRGNKLCMITKHSSTFCLEQVICLTSRGISGQVTRAKSDSDSHLVCVSTDRLCGDRLARFAVKAAFCLAPGRINKLATERATKYTRDKGNEFLAKLAELGNRQMEERLLTPVRRYGVRPEDIYFHTTSDQVRVHVDVKTGPTGPARPLAPDTAVAVQIHQTLIEGVGARNAGRTLTAKEISSVLRPAARRAGLELPTTLALVNWSITLAKREPVRLRIEDDHFDLTVRLDGFTIEEDRFPPVEIAARYLLAQRDGWPLLRRQGRVGVRVLAAPKKAGDGERWREELVELLEGILVPELALEQVMRDELAPLVRQSGLQDKPRVTARHGWLLTEYAASADIPPPPRQPPGPTCPR